ncbi:MAG: hypothetical protein PUC55_04500 [Lachnospiraceae bacterium]|nr:hypothetical protein [Lachnospiraceae bacterium]HCJ09047.1 hypothetical protein [Lachnospiraceae bacterium]
MATIAEKSRTKDIIDRLQSILDTASPVPLASGKVTIYKDEVQSLLTELASQIEIELKTYHEVNDRKGKIINEAKKEAEKIIYEAEHSASRMRVNKRTTNVAPINYDELTEEERGALTNANEIYGASLIYTDEMLNEVNQLIETAYQNIQTDYQTILQNMEQKMSIIAANRAELMDGLQEMDTADRSQQIVEIGHLLSDELYNARMRNHVGGDQYDDGSVQLSMDFQQMQEERARMAEEKAEQAAEQALAAETKSAQVEAALANMMAERDALALKVAQIQKEKEALANTVQNAAVAATQAVAEAAAAEEDEEEYEIVYVTEDELEEGEEYEIEYVDEDELEEGEEYEIEYVEEEAEQETAAAGMENGTEPEMQPEEESEPDTVQASVMQEDIVTAKQDTTEEDTKETAAPVSDAKNTRADVAATKKTDGDVDSEVLPLIPHFKKSEKITSVPSERIAKMADTVTTDPKYRGLISKAVDDKKVEEGQNTEAGDSAQTDSAAEQNPPVQRGKKNRRSKKRQAMAVKNAESVEKDTDIKKDENGQEYVQATMKFDDHFEIMEF